MGEDHSISITLYSDLWVTAQYHPPLEPNWDQRLSKDLHVFDSVGTWLVLPGDGAFTEVLPLVLSSSSCGEDGETTSGEITWPSRIWIWFILAGYSRTTIEGSCIGLWREGHRKWQRPFLSFCAHLACFVFPNILVNFWTRKGTLKQQNLNFTNIPISTS